jgi:putative endonuclease
MWFRYGSRWRSTPLNHRIEQGFSMAWMYILECSDGSYYIGSTNNLERRLSEHQEGLGARYTTRRLPVKLVYCEEYDRIADAFYREKQVQGWRRAKREALINGHPRLLSALAKKVFDKGKINKNDMVNE